MKTIKLFYKKAPKTISFLLTLMILANIFSSGFLIYNLFLYQGIEIINTIRLVLIGVLFIFNLMLFLVGINITLKRHWFKLIIFLLILGSISYGMYFLSENYINKIYRSITNISEKNSNKSMHLVSLSSAKIENTKDIKNETIGIINKDSDQEQYDNSQALITELDLTNDVKTYDEYIPLLKDLIDKKIELAILPGGYELIYNDVEGLENIANNTKIIYSKDFKTKTRINKNSKITEPFTILIMGIDGVGKDISKANSINGDSLMLITFNPKTLNTTMLSIPRDSYVPIMCMANDKKNKITHAGIGGEKCMIETIENFTDITIDYYVKINFQGVVQLVDDLGGIDVDVPINFCEQDSNRRKGKYKICLNKGLQHLNGEQALALSRHRKTIDDFRRGYNQQLVVNAMVNKTKNITNLNTATNMLNTVSMSMKTNMTTKQIMSLLDLMQKSMGKEKFVSERLYLSGYGQMIYDSAFKLNLYNYVLYEQSIEDVVNAMQINLGIKKAKIIKEFSFDANELYVVPEIGRGSFNKNSTNGKVLPNFVGSDKSYIQNWCDQNSVKVTFITKNVTNEKQNNKAIEQSEKTKTDISTINRLTITIGKYVAPTSSTTTETTTEATGTILS